jgi:predicted AlkP superfamily phosphohydrolase/phosphomutase/Flp pilus assembly protein TadD
MALVPVLAASCSNPAAEGQKTARRRSAVEDEDPPRRAASRRDHARVILVGLDGADWSLLDRLIAAGRMPSLARLVGEGRTARLKSSIPLLSPIIWTSIATGTTPERHGVLDFLEVDPATGMTVPISGRSRRVPAMWNLASFAGRRVGVVGWWATQPAEEVNGFFVSDRASAILSEGSKESLAYPSSLAEGVGRVIDEETHVSDAELMHFVKASAAEIAAVRAKGGGLENPAEALAKILAATRTVQRIARELYDRETPDLTAVYFEGTDVIGHVFAADVPPRLACASEEDFQRYSGTVDAYYEMIDRLLGQWMRRAREDGATLLVCSDHGFKWGEDRSCQRSSLNWATAAFWHRIDGVLALWGERVKASPSRGEASIYDIAPSVLALLGLPVDPKMSGRPLLADFTGVEAPPRRELYGAVKVRRLPASAPPAAEAEEYARKLRALGYLSGSESKSVPTLPEGPWPGRTEGAWNNLGILQRESGSLEEADRSFREALRIRPDYASPMFNLAGLRRTQGRWEEARNWLFRSFDAGHAEPEQTVLQWVTDAVKAGKRREAVSLLEMAVSRYPRSEVLAVALARLRFEAKDCAGAVAALSAFGETGGRDCSNVLGLSELCLGHAERARRLLERSLSLDPAQPPIREALRMIEVGK